MKITVLMENTCSPSVQGLTAEHGLSLLIEQEERWILLDTGASGTFADNAHKLGISLDKVDDIVISHNHYDHMGGIQRILEENKTAKVHIRAEAKRNYFRKGKEHMKYLGGPKTIFLEFPERFIFLEKDTFLTDSVLLMQNQILNESYFCQDHKKFYRQTENSNDSTYQPDTFDHEQFLCIRGENGLTIVTSCSHNGIVNILATVRQAFPDTPIQNVVGGFHMMSHRPDSSGKMQECMNCKEEFADDVANQLKAQVSGKIASCHCTGKVAFDQMKRTLGEQLVYISTGDTLSL